MMQFLELPRELRDMIYKEILMPSERLPSRQDTQSASKWYLISQPHQTIAGSRIFISSREVPSTCANILASNRQINEEMTQIVERARETGQLATRMDCFVQSNAHYFTWLALPCVKPTKPGALEQQEEGKQSWMSMIIDSWSWIASVFSGTAYTAKGNSRGKLFSTSLDPSYATIERLWMDIRSCESSASHVEESQTSWAVCAALKHLFDNGPDMTRRNRRVDCVDEVILNIVPLPDGASSSYPGHESDEDTLFVPESHETATNLLRNELVEVWDKIWSSTDANGNDIKAMLYRTLLGKIKRVRICVDGVTFRTRGLAVELERGRAEMRRIQMR
ncbi:hypothetical protein yc1106_00742 [Curvularia clavata]|uniref:Uncharacterized protein n=1 Tax=Curvularia clavata TaxID=95742 RepID=A0A9Q8Z336_CURCL|nr:hypothetical protein yc1106_00742 [Curvularia clavata]